eukprot:1404220-Prorocentrum_lima.AAC.1
MIEAAVDSGAGMTIMPGKSMSAFDGGTNAGKHSRNSLSSLWWTRCSRHKQAQVRGVNRQLGEARYPKQGRTCQTYPPGSK